MDNDTLDVVDRLIKLHSTDPEKFEEVRKEAIEKAILAGTPEQQDRMRKVQWRWEQELDRHKNPTNRYNCMVEIFWRGVREFIESLDSTLPKHLSKGTKEASKEKSVVLPFKKR